MENLEKGQIVELKIDNIGSEGDGVGRIDDFVIFVKNALPSEVVKVKILSVSKSYAKAQIVDFLEKAHFRKNPECPHYSACGGCDFMHVNYYKTIDFKIDILFNNLKNIGKQKFNRDKINFIKAENKLYYRNKAIQFFDEKNGQIKMGFYKKGTHKIVDVPKCKIIDSRALEMLNFIRENLKKYGIEIYNRDKNRGNLKAVGYRKSKRTNKYMLFFITKKDKINNIEKLVKKMDFQFSGIESVYVNVNKNDNVNLSDKNIKIMGKDFLEMYIGKAIYKILPNTFFQINSEQTEKLYNTILKYLPFERMKIVWDLYGGVGAISFFIASEFKKVYMIDSNKTSCDLARKNKTKNFATNVEVIHANLENYDLSNLEKPGVVILDPPRRGIAQNVVNYLKKIKPVKLILISCDSATLSRDIHKFDEIYDLKKISLIDMFPQTHLIESIALLERK